MGIQYTGLVSFPQGMPSPSEAAPLKGSIMPETTAVDHFWLHLVPSHPSQKLNFPRENTLRPEVLKSSVPTLKLRDAK